MQREINILNEISSDKNQKKQALQKILTISKENNSVQVEILPPVLKTLVDPIEKCRELSVSILHQLALKLDPFVLLKDFIPVLVKQLGQKEIKEPSEEIRLELVRLLHGLIVKAPSLDAFIPDVITILSKTSLDTFQDIRKESFKCMIALCKHKGVAHHCATLTKLILPSLTHRHSSVRCSALQALDSVVIVDATAIDDTIEPLRTLTRDKSPQVRNQLYILAKDWLTQLIDRHVYGYQILPFLYAGLTDEITTLQSTCQEFMEIVGEQYEKENNSKIKDELDYTDGISRTGRPRVGCRHLAHDNIGKIVSRHVELISDWNLDTRFKAVQTLNVFIYHAEDKITGYINLILPAVYKLLAGDEPHVMNETIKLMETIGKFVSPQTTLQLILPAITTGGLSNFRLGCLRALNGVLQGSSVDSLSSSIQQLLDCLSDRELIQNENIQVLIQVAHCLLSISTKIPKTEALGLQYFMVCISLSSFPGNEKVQGWVELQQTVQQALAGYTSTLGTTINDLYSVNFDQALRILKQSFTTWTQYSFEPRVLQNLLFNSGDKFMSRFDILLPILITCGGMDKDFELRESMVRMMLHLFSTVAVEKSLLNPVLPVLIKEFILVGCVWRAGRKAIALREISIHLFLAILNLFDPSEIAFVIKPLFSNDIIPVVLSNLDDDLLSTRQNSLSILDYVLKINTWDAESFKKVYPEMLKRLDDAKDQVRIQVCGTFQTFFSAVKSWTCSFDSLKAQLSQEDLGQTAVVHDGVLLEIALDKGHFESILDGLLIHLDDTNRQVQEAVFNAILAGKESQLIELSLLEDRVQKAKEKFRSIEFLNKLI